LKESETKGFSATKIFGFYGIAKEENKQYPTVKELDNIDQKAGGTEAPIQDETDETPF